MAMVLTPKTLTYVNIVFLSNFAKIYEMFSQTQLESSFMPLNPKVHISPTQLAWHPFDLPSSNKQVDFIDGLVSVAGNGDPLLREGLIVHVYLANASMGNKAFVNSDGDMLILPQQGRLDIQTEVGRYVVRTIHQTDKYILG